MNIRNSTRNRARYRLKMVISLTKSQFDLCKRLNVDIRKYAMHMPNRNKYVRWVSKFEVYR